MAARVSVDITTVSGGDALHFSGAGELRRDGRGIHLTYCYENSGEAATAELHLGTGRAVLSTAACRLLLDPRRATQAHLTAEGGTLPLTVDTHRVEARLDGDAGTITLHYTLLARGRPLQTMEVSLALAPMDKETTV